MTSFSERRMPGFRGIWHFSELSVSIPVISSCIEKEKVNDIIKSLKGNLSIETSALIGPTVFNREIYGTVITAGVPVIQFFYLLWVCLLVKAPPSGEYKYVFE